MARVLIVVPPLVGHINPTIALGNALHAAGHTVAWVGYPAALAERVPPWGEALLLPADIADVALDAVRDRGMGLRGAAAFKFLWEDLFLPLARAMLPGVDAAIAAWGPDVVVHDQQAFAGALAARRAGVRWVTSAATSAQLVDPFDTLPQFRTWLDERVVALQTEAGLDASAGGLLSPHAVIAWTTAALAGPDRAWPAHWHLVGPPIAPRSKAVPFPWEALDASRDLILVSLGTVNADVGGRFFAEALTALRGMPDVQAVVVAPDGLLSEVPEHVIVRPYVPQLDLLPRARAVVCHAGHNTTVEALAHGVPLVVAPIRDDQPVVAQQVVDAGAGVRVRFGRVRADGLGAAIAAVRTDPSYRQAAARIADSFRAAGGPARAASVVVSVTDR